MPTGVGIVRNLDLQGQLLREKSVNWTFIVARTTRALVQLNDDDIQKGANGTCVDDEDSVLPSRRDSARRLDDGRYTIRRKTSAARVACDAARISRRRGAHTSSLCPLHGRLA